MMRKWVFILAACVLPALLVPCGGCYKPTSGPVIVAGIDYQPAVERRVVGTSVKSRPIECLVAGQGPDVTFIVATIHGDEAVGTSLVRRLAEHLQEHASLLEGRKAVLVPVANPDGMAAKTRFNACGVDLNRNFPAVNRVSSELHGQAALSEPEARIIEQLIRQYSPDRIVSIHQLTDTGPEALSHRVPDGCIDYDGPAKGLADQMARYCDLPVEGLGAAPGSLGSYAGLRLGIPIITFELPLYARWLDLESLWKRYGGALIAAVVYPEAVK